jgi:hypothetical protein
MEILGGAASTGSRASYRRKVMKGRLWIVSGLLAMAAASASATPAKKKPEPPFMPVILVDLVSADNEHPVASRVYTFSDDDDDSPLVAQLLAMVRPVAALQSSAVSYRVLGFMRDHGQELSRHSSNRWVSHQGDSVEVVVFAPEGQTPTITFEEAARQSRLTSDIDSLVETAGSIGQTEENRPRGNISVTRRKYRLRDDRAILKISADVEAADEKKGQPKGDDRDKDKGADPPVITTIITGPSERVFLSANAAYTKIRQTKYNASEQSFEYGNKPTELLIGVNYSLHDLFQNDNSTGLMSFVRGMYVSVLVEPTKRPFNQIATAVGFRHSPPPFESLFSMETVSPYVGVVWARDDVPDPLDATHVRTRYGKPAFIMGLALGLDRAIGWFEGSQQ